MEDMTSTHSPLRRAVAAASLALFLPLGLAACSSSDDAGTASGTSAGVGAAWSACMRDAGFPVADATDEQVSSGTFQVPAGSDQASFSSQAGTCARSVGVEGASDAENQKWDREYDAVASCIRENGYPDFPPQEPGVIGTGDYVRASEPAFEEVWQTCLAEHSPDTRSAN